MTMTTMIQLIDVEWTKESRGAPQAIKRNAVPEVVAFEPENFENNVYLQSIKYFEFNGFKDPRVFIQSINSKQQRQYGLELDRLDHSVRVYLWGIPMRKSYEKEKLIGELQRNTWLKIVGNVRVTLECTWAYHKYVYNIFFGDAKLFNRTLLNQQPVAVYRDEQALW